MTKPVRLDDEAEDELAAAASWYERHRPSLGWELLAAVAETLRRIEEAPRACSLVPGVPRGLQVRRMFPHRFPYSVVFIEMDQEIRVIAIAHVRRRPAYWRERIQQSSRRRTKR